MEKEFENLYQHFNTSYVAVQRHVRFWLFLHLCHFNTSYVAVQLFDRHHGRVQRYISIHLMLRFNGYCEFEK